jgi:hypothetical protein
MVLALATRGGFCYAESGEKANWGKNLMSFPEEVYVQIGWSRFHAPAQAIRDRQELKRILTRFCLDSPGGCAQRDGMGCRAG